MVVQPESECGKDAPSCDAKTLGENEIEERKGLIQLRATKWRTELPVPPASKPIGGPPKPPF